MARTPFSCSGCGTVWYRRGYEHCSARGCHQTFASTQAGDLHRVGPHDGDRRCLHSLELSELRKKDGSQALLPHVDYDDVLVWVYSRD